MRALDNERLLRFENNDPAEVRQLTMDATLAQKAAYQLDWTGTWRLHTDMPFYDLQREDSAPLEVIIRFELPAPIRVGKLLTAGFGLSRPAVRGMVDSGRIRRPCPSTPRPARTSPSLSSPPHRRHPSGHEVPPRGAVTCAAGGPYHPARRPAAVGGPARRAAAGGDRPTGRAAAGTARVTANADVTMRAGQPPATSRRISSAHPQDRVIPAPPWP